VEERAQWPRARRQRPCGFNKHPAGLSASLMRDVTVERGVIARLVNRRVQAQIADQLLRAREALDVADGSQYACSDDGVDASDCHQAPHVRIIQRALREISVDDGQLGCQALEFIVVAQCHSQLICRQRHALDSSATLPAKDATRHLRDQVRVKDGLDPVLQPRHLRDELGSLGDDAPLQFNFFGGHPHLGEEPSGVQSRQGRSVDLVGLDLGPGDRAHLQRIGDDDTMHERL